MSKTLSQFIAIADFLGDEMTEKQASKLMDEAKTNLSYAEIEEMYSICYHRNFYTELSMYDGEMGGLSRY